MIQETIGLLGFQAKDRITGFTGVIESVCFDLYGCVQVLLKPPMTDRGELNSGVWFDVARVEVYRTKRVMPVPDFEAKAVKPKDYAQGAATKPLRHA